MNISSLAACFAITFIALAQVCATNENLVDSHYRRLTDDWFLTIGVSYNASNSEHDDVNQLVSSVKEAVLSFREKTDGRLSEVRIQYENLPLSFRNSVKDEIASHLKDWDGSVQSVSDKKAVRLFKKIVLDNKWTEDLKKHCSPLGIVDIDISELIPLKKNLVGKNWKELASVSESFFNTSRCYLVLEFKN